MIAHAQSSPEQRAPQGEEPVPAHVEDDAVLHLLRGPAPLPGALLLVVHDHVLGPRHLLGRGTHTSPAAAILHLCRFYCFSHPRRASCLEDSNSKLKRACHCHLLSGRGGGSSNVYSIIQTAQTTKVLVAYREVSLSTKMY